MQTLYDAKLFVLFYNFLKIQKTEETIIFSQEIP